MKRWDFCPKYMVPRTKPPQAQQGMSMNGWNFSSRPRVPYQKSFVVKLQGMYWHLHNSTGLFDEDRDPRYNARRLERFYEEHGTWKPFEFPHPHLGLITCRFKEPVEIPEAIVNAGGLVDAFDVQLIHHDPRF